MEDKYKDLKAMLICTLIAILATPMVYKIVFAPIGWWIK